jgi:ketopantoate reductase
LSEPKILFIGAGAIGASVAAWVAESYKLVWIMGRGEAQEALRKDGITTYDFAAPAETRRTMRIPTITRPGELDDIDIVVLAVKNYGLEASRCATSSAIGRSSCRWRTASTTSAFCRSSSAR